MPFNSNTARVAGQKSKRGKAKYTTEIRDKLNNLTDYLIQDLNIQDLDTNEKLALLRILLAYTLPKPKIDSSLLFFSPKKNFYKIKNPKNLEKVTRIFFNQRRKMLKKPFNQLFNGNQRVLNELKIDLNLRPQNLDFDTYYQLTCAYENLQS